MRLNAQEKNSFEALWQLVRFAKLKITETSLKASLLQSRDNNTIIALSDILIEYYVPNMVVRLSPHQLNEIPLPAIAFFEENGGSFATITKIEDNNIEWLHNQAGIVKEGIDDFASHWNGITLLIEPNEQSGEANYKASKKAESIETLRISLIALGILSILSFTIFTFTKQLAIDANWKFYSLLLTKTIGLIISIMLLWNNFDTNNSFLKSVCKLNERTNCNNILNSKAAKIFNWLSWSEIGLFYFSGGLTALLFLRTEAIIPILGLAVLVFPYTIWSIYYQGFVAKEWCPLCLVIQAIICVEFALFVKNDFYSVSFQSLPLVHLLLAFAIAPLFWALVKNNLQKAMQTDTLYNEFQKMKFDPEYVQAFMSKQQVLPPIFEGMTVIELGEPNAENELILVLSPSCASCRQTYLVAKKLIETNESINCKIIFAASLSEKDFAGIVARKILSLSNEIEMKKTLEKWFSDDYKNTKIWTTLVINREENAEGINQMGMHLRWLSLAGVDEAPKAFFNNAEIPKQYQITELLKLLNISKTNGFANQV